MVRRTGFRIQDSGCRIRGSGFALALLWILFCSSLVTRHSSLPFAQPPQAQQGQPFSALNATSVNGIVPGYWTTAGTGLTLNLSAGTALCGNPPALVTYSGGTLSMRAAATNYVYLDPLASCAPKLNTSGFGVGQVPIAVVVTNASGITTVNDLRSWSSPPVSTDSSGRAILKGLNGTYFADQLGDKSTTGIASAISACGTSTPCRVVVPGSYPPRETVPGGGRGGAGGAIYPGTTSSNVQVQDFRYGDWQTAINASGNGASNRPWHQWTEDLYLPPPSGSRYQGHSNFMPIINVLDGGVLLDNGSMPYYAKSNAQGMFVNANNYTPGIINNVFMNNQYAVGDSTPVYAIDNFYGGFNTQGEEGEEGVDIWVVQGVTAYQATIASGGSIGTTSLTLSPTAGAGTQGAGRYLIDTAPGQTISAGTISAISNNAGGTPVTFTGNGTRWPVSTVNTTSTQAVPAPGVQTVTLASVGGITTSTVLVFCDGSAYETLIPTAVGSNSITANFHAPHSSGAIVAAGGLSGYFLELTADTVPASVTQGTALRQAWPVLYSSSSTSLAAYVIGQGAFGAFQSGVATAWANTSGSNGYVLYPGAQVLSVYSNGNVGNTFGLMPNTVAWATGDTVELPQYPDCHSLIGTWNLRSWWPENAPYGPVIDFSGVTGYGATGTWLRNSTPSSYYRGGGGDLDPPASGVRIEGPWTSGVRFLRYGPNFNGLWFNGQAWGTVGMVYPIVVGPPSGNADSLGYDQVNRDWLLTENSQGGTYTFGSTFTAPGHLGSLTSDTQGSVTITRGTSATVNFSSAFRHPPICTLTPKSDPTSVGAYWVTANTTSMTANVKVSGTIAFNYTCTGDPN